MKKHHILFIIVLITVILVPQAKSQWQNNLAKKSPAAGKLTLNEISKAFNDYWTSYNVRNGFYKENGKEKKAPGWKLFKREEYYWEQRVNAVTGEFPATNAIEEYSRWHQSLKKGTVYTANWVNLGTNTSVGGYAGLGRINCVAFHPTDVNTIWVSSPSGGLWKTTDGGATWTILNNSQAVIGVSDIIIPSDYATSNTIYIATGDRDGGSMWTLGGGQAADNASVGVLKSTDGGATWSATGLTYLTSAGKLVYRLLIHPSNNQILFASTSDGIYKTTDGGATWTQKSVNVWIDMEFKPGDPTIMYASSNGYSSAYLNRSTNSGENWTLSTVATRGSRGELAVSANNAAVVYMLVSNSGGGVLGVYKSTDSGVSFTKVNNNSGTAPGMLSYYSDGSGAATGQGWYDWCIVASPTDVNTVFIGGITTWKSTDGGVNWTINNMWTSSPTYNFVGAPEVHADKHALAFQNSTTLFEGNDGGIYKTTNGGTSWTDLTNGLIISQIYRIGVSKTDNTKILSGLQDNGSKKYNGAVNTWTDVYGGDGLECIIDPNNATSYMYVSYVYGEIHRSTNGFGTLTTTQISANIPGGQPAGAWVTPYIINPKNSASLYAGYNVVYKTTNHGDAWSSISQSLSPSTKLRSLAVAPSDTNVLYTADQTNMWKTTNGGTSFWSSITLPTITGNPSITYITVKNNDPNTVWITYGGFTSGSKVYQSTDGGGTWTSISTGLPNIPVMCLVQYTVATDRVVLFAGTDVGVYVKDGAADWSLFSNGLPNVVVTELEFYYGPTQVDDRLRAGTFGRGLWETTIPSLLPVEISMFSAILMNDNLVKLDWTTATEVNNYGFEVQRSTDKKDWTTLQFVKGHGNSNSPQSYSFDDRPEGYDKFYYRLKQIDADGRYELSNVNEVKMAKPSRFAVEQNYPNPFNPATTITYSLPGNGVVSLKIYDALGREVKTLVNEYKQSGTHRVSFDATTLASGMYIYKLVAGSYTAVKRMSLLK